MEIDIIGFPQSGKTTLFRGVNGGLGTRQEAAGKPGIGVAKVPDQRVLTLESIFKPRKTVLAEITFFDLPVAPEGLGKTSGIGGEYLNLLQRADALLHVVRAFEDPSVPHVQGSVDPARDIADMNLELAYSDIAILQNRLDRLEAGLKGTRSLEREAKGRERELISGVKEGLEREVPIRDQTLDPEAARILENFNLLTAKPILIVVNIGEEQLAQRKSVEEMLPANISGSGVRGAIICGKLESELVQLEEEEERAEFRQSMGLDESGLSQVIRMSYDVLGLLTFFTTGEDEVRAWPIPKGTPAVKAAGKIHNDLERGFIKAEVIAYDDLVECGSVAEARRKGLLRVEGKSYVVKEGDNLTIMFNV